jgi:hypothetical protein
LAAVALFASLVTVFAPRADAEHDEYFPGDAVYNSTDYWENYLNGHDGVDNSVCEKDEVESESDFVAEADYRLVIIKKASGDQANRLYWNVEAGDVLAPGPGQGNGQGYSHVIVCWNTPNETTTTTEEETTTTTGYDTTTTTGYDTTTTTEQETTTTTEQETTTTTEQETTTTTGYETTTTTEQETTTTTIGSVTLDPEIDVTKTAGVETVEAPGENVTFTVVVSNSGPVSVAITSLEDDIYGVLAGDDDCKVGTVLAPGASCSFDFVGFVGGEDGDEHNNTVTVNGEDESKTPVDADDDATVDVLGTEVEAVEVLPFTGIPTDYLLVAALILLMSGAGMVAIQRRNQES